MGEFWTRQPTVETAGYCQVSLRDEHDWIQIACQLTGSGDTAAGHAWFDDIELEEIP